MVRHYFASVCIAVLRPFRVRMKSALASKHMSIAHADLQAGRDRDLIDCSPLVTSGLAYQKLDVDSLSCELEQRRYGQKTMVGFGVCAVTIAMLHRHALYRQSN